MESYGTEISEFENELVHFLKHVSNQMSLISNVSTDWDRQAQMTSDKGDSLYYKWESLRRQISIIRAY